MSAVTVSLSLSFCCSCCCAIASLVAAFNHLSCCIFFSPRLHGPCHSDSSHPLCFVSHVLRFLLHFITRYCHPCHHFYLLHSLLFVESFAALALNFLFVPAAVLASAFCTPPRPVLTGWTLNTPRAVPAGLKRCGSYRRT